MAGVEVGVGMLVSGVVRGSGVVKVESLSGGGEAELPTREVE